MGEEAFEEIRVSTRRSTVVMRRAYGDDHVWIGISRRRTSDDDPDVIIDVPLTSARRVAEALMGLVGEDY